jgi:hypothetical protein
MSNYKATFLLDQHGSCASTSKTETTEGNRARHVGPRSYPRSLGRILAQLIGTLLLVGIIGAYFWWIAGALAIAALVWMVHRAFQDMAAAELAEARRQAAIAKRADQQHRWVLAGDERGVYGPDGARLMRVIRS